MLRFDRKPKQYVSPDDHLMPKKRKTSAQLLLNFYLYTTKNEGLTHRRCNTDLTSIASLPLLPSYVTTVKTERQSLQTQTEEMI